MKTVPLKKLLLLLLTSGCLTLTVSAQDTASVAHVFVALCDNVNQGIVPVPSFLGNGQDPDNNLYWGARYGLKTYARSSHNWTLCATIKNPAPPVLERCVFKFNGGNAYLVADAYEGAEIERAVTDFLKSASGNRIDSVVVDGKAVGIGGASDLVAYVGHNGLMDFRLQDFPMAADSTHRPVIILACASRAYFKEAIDSAGAYALLWTTGLMAPEAYTLLAALEAWIEGSESEVIRSKAARAYDRYQGCGVSAAMRLLVSDKVP